MDTIDLVSENKELKNKITELQNENNELNEQVNKYSSPQKSYYQRNKEIINAKAKERMKKLSKENPDKLKEINRKAYLKRKEKLKKQINEDI